MSDLAGQKTQARHDGFARRKAAHAADPGTGAGVLSAFLAGHRGVPLSGYMPIRTEIDPRPAMAEAAAYGPVGIPVILGDGQPLEFARWEPDMPLVAGAFGALIPEEKVVFEPEIVIVPLVAFDARGGRLGYGGGFYDRTLAQLRAKRPTLAVGFAYAAQEADALPLEPTDQRLDFIVTETGMTDLRQSSGGS
ncbi:5-formyltetrahydrofolate cyclo-ligase [Roseobacter sinensis]|uniref:5-formyltetrahydrofolate cyclo-ligase n=1 Tax=Roseobacter sinensis TaxID=2931391 RepID=A0ABT3BIN1_9RHOB|nr:5-formyltetrahydrofolate cyclo-ligase [Roseobacter sp. WL0113]MCV3272984.1 5-formyltetrahydrofolate cyclo-ligase [Roseobacter sp. WL0113]